jgi:hypothetical protein
MPRITKGSAGEAADPLVCAFLLPRSCLTYKSTADDHPKKRLTGPTRDQAFRFEEAPMELPEDIRRMIEKNSDQDTILDVVSRLQSEGVKITHDVIAAIVATIAATKGGAVC